MATKMIKRQDITAWLAKFENGSSGEDVAYSTQMPVLLGMLTLGIMVAMVGFWRMGAFMGSEKGAFKAATASGDGITAGKNASSEVFREWSNDQRISNSASNIQRDADGRSTSSSIEINRNIGWFAGTSTNFAVSASSAQRWERFYGGPPKCSATECKE